MRRGTEREKKIPGRAAKLDLNLQSNCLGKEARSATSARERKGATNNDLVRGGEGKGLARRNKGLRCEKNARRIFPETGGRKKRRENIEYQRGKTFNGKEQAALAQRRIRGYLIRSCKKRAASRSCCGAKKRKFIRKNRKGSNLLWQRGRKNNVPRCASSKEKGERPPSHTERGKKKTQKGKRTKNSPVLRIAVEKFHVPPRRTGVRELGTCLDFCQQEEKNV